MTNKEFKSDIKNHYKGIVRSHTGKKWKSYVTFENKRLNLGTYTKLSEAIQVHDDKIVELYGENVITNKKLIADGLLNSINSINDYVIEPIIDEPGEIWLDIFNYIGLYQISNNGRVKSLARIDILGHKKDDIIRKPKKHRDGYLSVGLYLDGKAKMFTIHRLVAKAFIPNPENKPCVNHLFGKKDDNNACHLEWATYRENAIHALKIGLAIPLRGSDHHASKLIEDEIKEIRRLYREDKLKFTEIARFYNVTAGNIQHIVENKTWKHVI